jgi:hypothetical protein
VICDDASRGGGIRTHDLFVPNDSEQAIWLTWASDGKRRKMPASQHLSINFTQASAIAVARENVPACVPAKSALVLTGGTDRYSARTAMGSERPHYAMVSFTAAVGRGTDKARGSPFSENADYHSDFP